jgi:alkylation response protein AidB-like acyl-CoA dehydrogenase
MRSIGAAELALEMMVERSIERKAFGKQLNQHGTIRDWIARSRIDPPLISTARGHGGSFSGASWSGVT